MKTFVERILLCISFFALSSAFVVPKTTTVAAHGRSVVRRDDGWLLPAAQDTAGRCSTLCLNAIAKKNKKGTKEEDEGEEMKPFEKVASMGVAGVLAIAVAEAIFWAAGMPLAELYYKYTTGEWIDLTTADGQLKAAGFSFGYGGFATVILQYRVTIFAIPLVPIMDKYVVQPLLKGGLIESDGVD